MNQRIAYFGWETAGGFRRGVDSLVFWGWITDWVTCLIYRRLRFRWKRGMSLTWTGYKSSSTSTVFCICADASLRWGEITLGHLKSAQLFLMCSTMLESIKIKLMYETNTINYSLNIVLLKEIFYLYIYIFEEFMVERSVNMINCSLYCCSSQFVIKIILVSFRKEFIYKYSLNGYYHVMACTCVHISKLIDKHNMRVELRKGSKFVCHTIHF